MKGSLALSLLLLVLDPLCCPGQGHHPMGTPVYMIAAASVVLHAFNSAPVTMCRGATPQDYRVLPRRIVLVRHAESEGNIDNFAYTYVPDPQVPLVRGSALPQDRYQLPACQCLLSTVMLGMDNAAGAVSRETTQLKRSLDWNIDTVWEDVQCEGQSARPGFAIGMCSRQRQDRYGSKRRLQALCCQSTAPPLAVDCRCCMFTAGRLANACPDKCQEPLCPVK